MKEWQKIAEKSKIPQDDQTVIVINITNVSTVVPWLPN